MNPPVCALEQTLASTEGAEAGWAFCSGMAAEMAVFAEYGRDGIVHR
jgi:cystathionine beta-lyase/cystathionine gamma-synthase